LASDDFTDSDGTGLESHDANWTGISATYPVTMAEINNNICEAEIDYNNRFGAYYNGSSEDTSEIVHKGTCTTDTKFVTVRADTDEAGYACGLSTYSAGKWGYWVWYKSGNYFSDQNINGLGLDSGDHTIKVTVSGTTTVTWDSWVDGSARAQKTDSTSPLGSGNPGFYNDINDLASETGFDDWTDGVVSGLSVSVADSVSIAESIGPAQNLGPISKSESITIAELIQLIIPILPSVADGVSVTELVQILMKLNINVSESISVTEFISVIKDILVDVSDSVAVAEAITMKLGILLSIYDSITITEAVTILKDILPNVADSITVTDVVTVVVPELDLSIDVSDVVSIAEAIGAVKDQIITVTENILMVMSIEVTASDVVTIVENVLAKMSMGGIDISDSVNITELITAVIELAPILPSVLETLTIIESIKINMPLIASTIEAITINELVNIAMNALFSVSDAITISEYVNILLSYGWVSLDGITFYKN
jgi:hypothetical protein